MPYAGSGRLDAAYWLPLSLQFSKRYSQAGACPTATDAKEPLETENRAFNFPHIPQL
jgi:hypothetical protein